MFQARLLRQALVSCFVLLALVAINFFVFPALAAEKARLRVENYDIDAELSPRAHKLTAKAKVRFTALDDLSAATFELHNALRPTKVTDEAGRLLQVDIGLENVEYTLREGDYLVIRHETEELQLTQEMPVAIRRISRS